MKQALSCHGGSAIKAAKVIPASALVGMQGTLDHLASMLQQSFTTPPKGNNTGGSEIVMVMNALKLLSGPDKDLALDKQSFLMMGIKEDMSIVMFYAGTPDQEVQHKFVHDLYMKHQHEGPTLSTACITVISANNSEMLMLKWYYSLCFSQCFHYKQ
ncbi:hypothetical protein PAXRUDRAFT_161682 [Paxillus rubicundulus Ve08.2h10]|uniref:Uncharacterized protein n=1 Tax=Paxillus rubicundulus Ve08.2h10 TaxID=930991 RepID=A0A0D0CUZ5_9AGAM|nr:hypothetical protein PAXRUDRAFT_161682 [Paxillus rubicundulus Ve08.2h10]